MNATCLQEPALSDLSTFSLTAATAYAPSMEDADPFERLALEQMDTLYRVARRLTRDAERAGDLVQETYLKAFRAKDNFELKEYGIRPWLLRIMQNLHISRSGREQRHPVAMKDASLEAAERDSAPEIPGVPMPIDIEDFDQQLLAALELLPVDYQVVVLMWGVDDLTYKQIAHTLDIPLGTVMSRLHRARQKLGEQLRDYAVNEGVIRHEHGIRGECPVGVVG